MPSRPSIPSCRAAKKSSVNRARTIVQTASADARSGRRVTHTPSAANTAVTPISTSVRPTRPRSPQDRVTKMKPGDDEPERAERQQDRADRPTAFLGRRLLSHARVRRHRAAGRLTSGDRRGVRGRCRRRLGWGICGGRAGAAAVASGAAAAAARRTCERVRGRRRWRRQHRAIPRERRPGQQLVSLQQRLPELPDLGRRQVEAAVRARRLTGDCAATVRTGLRVCEAHGLTVS